MTEKKIANMVIIMSFKDLWPFTIGDRVMHVLHGAADTRHLLVVDVNPSYVSTPYPCVMTSWKQGGKVFEGCIETKYLRKAK